ncbi:hypothetical protein DQ04_00501150 [Trypanosoma grayi]|uniref:hypothetical protein n=1 Tax=Trypanosoma grayi TaxID=71804 RepID=UPI0004F3F284|nr:hypothetical protein DQ04_00501150 [Trypanosoma grayi]KEG14375.1 hypothetical protein DQ04_00501150 [Trypanosoma grayi]
MQLSCGNDAAKTPQQEEVVAPLPGDAHDDTERHTDGAAPRRRFRAARRREQPPHGGAFGSTQTDEPPRQPRQRIIRLSTLAAAVNPLHRYFSLAVHNGSADAVPFSPPCLRCPYCKGCQLHMQFCSGAYGMRHLLAWIMRRKPPMAGKRRTIEMYCTAANRGVVASAASSQRRVCRFEVGPVVITRHIIYASRDQTLETLDRGGTTGTFAGMVCPRPLNFLDVFFGIFYGTTERGRDTSGYHILQITAMRAVAAQARALWEKLTYSPERDTDAVTIPAGQYRPRDKSIPPRRVPVDWRCPALFFSLLPRAQVGNNGITFVLWLPELARHILTAYVMEDGEFWRAPHTCGPESKEEDTPPEAPPLQPEAAKEEEKTETESAKSPEVPEDAAEAPVSGEKWEGEVKCRRCYVPGNCWGLICRRHREERDITNTILRVRRACVRRRVVRRAILGNSGEWGPEPNGVLWINRHKARAQFMALMVAYMMRKTVCGPYKQRHLTPPPACKTVAEGTVYSV